MNLEITTKYNIGCHVYIPEFYEGYVVAGPYTITNIEININADRTKISYCVNNGDAFMGCFPEDRFFGTYDECAKWCEEHG